LLAVPPRRSGFLPGCAERPTTAAVRRAALRRPPASAPACGPPVAAPAGLLHPETGTPIRRSAALDETGAPPHPSRESAATPSAHLPPRQSASTPPGPPAASTARAETPRELTSPVRVLGVVMASPRVAENSSPGPARSAAGSCRTPLENPAHSIRCGIRPACAVRVHAAASRHSG